MQRLTESLGCNCNPALRMIRRYSTLETLQTKGPAMSRGFASSLTMWDDLPMVDGSFQWIHI